MSDYMLICSSRALSILIIVLPKAGVMCQDFLHFFFVPFWHPCYTFPQAFFELASVFLFLLLPKSVKHILQNYVNFLLLCNKSTQTEWLKIAPIYYVPVSIGQTCIWIWLGSQLQPSQYQNQCGGHTGVLPEEPLIKKLLTTSFQLRAGFSSLLL